MADVRGKSQRIEDGQQVQQCLVGGVLSPALDGYPICYVRVNQVQRKRT